MTVYVGPIFQCRGIAPRCFRGGASHMTADTVDELIRFARRLDLKPEWLQDGDRPDRFHFDIVPRRRSLAVSWGAQEVSDRELLTIMKRRGAIIAATATLPAAATPTLVPPAIAAVHRGVDLAGLLLHRRRQLIELFGLEEYRQRLAEVRPFILKRQAAAGCVSALQAAVQLVQLAGEDLDSVYATLCLLAGIEGLESESPA